MLAGHQMQRAVARFKGPGHGAGLDERNVTGGDYSGADAHCHEGGGVLRATRRALLLKRKQDKKKSGGKSPGRRNNTVELGWGRRLLGELVHHHKEFKAQGEKEQYLRRSREKGLQEKFRRVAPWKGHATKKFGLLLRISE